MTPEERRLAIEHVESRFLRGIDKDEDEAIGLLVERARLTLYGSLGMTAAAATAVSAMDRAPNLWWLGGGLLLLQAAAVFGWSGLQFAETVRNYRIVRKHLENRAGLHNRFGGVDPLYPLVSNEALLSARNDEQGAITSIRKRETVAAALIGFGFTCLLVAFVQVWERGPNLPAGAPSSPTQQDQEVPMPVGHASTGRNDD